MNKNTFEYNNLQNKIGGYDKIKADKINSINKYK